MSASYDGPLPLLCSSSAIVGLVHFLMRDAYGRQVHFFASVRTFSGSERRQQFSLHFLYSSFHYLCNSKPEPVKPQLV